jgi:hypothetical protein
MNSVKGVADFNAEKKYLLTASIYFLEELVKSKMNTSVVNIFVVDSMFQVGGQVCWSARPQIGTGSWTAWE